MHNQHHFQIGNGAGCANRVEVALHELAVASALCVFTAPDCCHVVALKGRAEDANVLGAEPGKWNGEIKTHSHLATTMIGKAVELLICLLASLPCQNFQILKRRRVDGRKTVGAVDAAGGIENLLASQRLRR